MNIGRTLFWFKDGDEMLIELNEEFFGLGILLNRLLNERYNGKKIKFINIDFATEKTYELHSGLPREDSYYYGGHLRYYGVFDKVQFEKFDKARRDKYVWDRAYDCLCKSAVYLKNDKLSEAAVYAHKRGLELDLNPDYRMAEADINFSDQQLRASIWVNFKEDGMYSKLTLEKQGKVIFEKNMDRTNKGVEFFLEMYKEIAFENDILVIKGHQDVAYLPLRIPLREMAL